jgi:hypothetical protein
MKPEPDEEHHPQVRIYAILSRLQRILEKYTDLRFGQLIVNIHSCSNQEIEDLFYLEDEDFLNGIIDLEKKLK